MKVKLNKNLSKFVEKSGFPYSDMYSLRNDASKRTYYRFINAKQPLLLMDSSMEKDSLKNFIFLSNWLRKKGYSAPEIYYQSLSKGYCILQDFGDSTFSNIKSRNIIERYKLTLDLLTSLSKIESPERLSFYSKEIFMRELNIFIEWYLFYKKNKSTNALSSWKELWNNLFEEASKYKKKSIVLRDLHIDNLFWLNNEKGLKKIGLIDFQDALVGQPCYDLTSLLQDVRINLSLQHQYSLYKHYINLNNVDGELFEKAYYIFGTQRLIKIIGVFFKLNYLYKKNNYMKYIPRTWELLKKNLQFPILKPLSSWFDHYVFK